jgi:hypothetical protein
MSVRRLLLSTSLLFATVAAACADASPTGTTGQNDGDDVVVTTTPPVTPQPGPTTPQNVPTLTVGMGDLIPGENDLFTSEIVVTVMNWPDPVVGEKVTFTIVKGSGTLSAAEVLTGVDGIARTTISFGLADEQVIQARTATSDLAETRILAYCAEAPQQRTLPCPQSR